MDYKYITQLLDRYWKAETTVEEENILRAFFSQTSVPEELKQYRCLFLYQATEPKTDVLDAAFDDRLLAIVGEEQKDTAKVKAHRITLKERMFPLFKADRKSNTSELQSHSDLVCRLLLEKKKKIT